MTVLIAGAGIAGLALGLSLHQIGVPFRVIEARAAVQPLGVGINLQPNAVRELYDLGLEGALDDIGVPLRDYRLLTTSGLELWREPRGIDAGYRWPAYSVHRGRLQMMLYEALLARAGPDAVLCGWRATGAETRGAQAVLHLRAADGAERQMTGALVLGADGIHSALRAQMVPDEGPPAWGGAVLWRGTTQAVPFGGAATMALVGEPGLRFVTYPISRPDPDTGLSTVNWICNLLRDPAQGYAREDYARGADLADFLPAFERMVFDGLDAPALIRGAREVFEYPMVDRDPLERWTHGRVSLLGDAAHAAYPVGSNGAGSGIIDARWIAAEIAARGCEPAALEAYEARLRPATSAMVLANRGAGPDKIIDTFAARAGDGATDVADVFTDDERAEHAARYKQIAGYGVAQTNDAAPIVPPEARRPLPT
ncbi:flavin-dependent oxidoreductase [Sulfitobacter albidus]|uniref:Flavin-dependent oxidoreductase n=1 Tax=Sulfitobacter albidus TaxID=2829501 RepID=A0A975JEV2_9RHOB|nr:flavin-dependent oxidoreductase [Sulfitobacter albidus]QUJ77212.1 flavin-dependent oxidoreductase [Sulfitobacter albidus]